MKIALLCLDKIGPNMAGPAIRYWEMAKALAPYHEVTLFSLLPIDLKSDTFETCVIKPNKLAGSLKPYSALISQPPPLIVLFAIIRSGIHWILDSYAPVPLEVLEIFKKKSLIDRNEKQYQHLAQTKLALEYASCVIAASSRQKDLWIGAWMALNKITPLEYDLDPSLSNTIIEVPFGVPNEAPKYTGIGPREKFNIKKSDHILLWGGGIWNWFDPLTIIKAVHLISQKRDDIKLVFMGTKHPNDLIPEMEMCSKAYQLSKDLNLLDKVVFFNFGWTPYEERQAYLLESSLGVLAHFDTLETRFAFRTRLLDCLWAGLPIIATEGDIFADWINQYGLGKTVPYNDAEAFAEAILTLIDNPEERLSCKRQCQELAKDLTWNKVIQPLLQTIKHLPKNRTSHSSTVALFKILKTKGVKEVFKKITNL